MDQGIRNKLRSVVTQCRKLLEEAVRQVLQGQFGIYESGKKDEVHVEDEGRMNNLSEEDKGYRRDIQAHLGHIEALGYKAKDALAQLVREIAFTHLNRLCAYKMMEAREVWVGGQRFRESVSRGMKSQGFQFYLADHPEDKQRFDTGHQDVAYRHFLGWLGALLSEEIGVLFSPTDPANRLFPPQRVLDDVLALLNSDDLKDIWAEDETIGWVYQYFTPKELRDQVRKESAAPRNSYELAFRNQFFTPRYVVEFLTDNTLGRIWYEMRKGDTKLKNQCRYMVRRPSEYFLNEGQTPPEPMQNHEDLSQEELLKQPVHIPHRPKKDPREQRILDPACGSGHFLLYCFALLLTIYEEAYADPDLGPNLKEDYPTLDALRRDVPRLILAHNLHGIDIDLRCTQIAALALWLRCQRAYRGMGLKEDRPKINKSNIVCAEPMPGEREMLDEFLKTLKQDRLEALIGRVMQVPEGSRVRATESMVESLNELVRLVWDKMQLAGEAGSLLKIEEELQEAVRTGQEEWEEKQPLFRFTEFNLTEKPKESYVRFVPGEGLSFWQRAEALVLEALRDYARHAANGGRLQRQLFADDAERGFAFIDICRKRFDVVLMNPPFGEVSIPSRQYLYQRLPETARDLFAGFISRAVGLLCESGHTGAITNRTAFFSDFLRDWRRRCFLGASSSLFCMADLGYGVLDAVVETAAYVVTKNSVTESAFVNVLSDSDKQSALTEILDDLVAGTPNGKFCTRQPTDFENMPDCRFAYQFHPFWIRKLHQHSVHPNFVSKAGLTSGDDFRFLRCFWEIPEVPPSKSPKWRWLAKGGEFSRYRTDVHLMIDWDSKDSLNRTRNDELYGRAGVTYTERTTSNLSARVLNKGCFFSGPGPGVIPANDADRHYLLAFLNSAVASYCLEAIVGGGDYSMKGTAARHLEPGYLQHLPCVELSDDDRQWFTTKVEMLVKKFNTLVDDESHPLFAGFIQVRDRSLNDGIAVTHRHHFQVLKQCYKLVRAIERRILAVLAIPAERVPDLYGDTGYPMPDNGNIDALPEGWRLSVDSDLPLQCPDDAIPRSLNRFENKLSYYLHGGVERLAHRFRVAPEIVSEELAVTAIPDPGIKSRSVQNVVSNAVGWLFGRWELSRTEASGKDEGGCIFDELPRLQPGRNPNHNGGGRSIIPDDPDHSDDIVRRVREVLELIWKDRADAIEKEACEILGIKELRDYFRKPGKGGFWDDHVSRYSKSRRKAPIYWLLQSSKKNYALWLYYHRLDKDILFKARQNYVDPKIRLEQSRLDSLRSQKTALGAAAKGAKKIDKDIEKQEALLGELKDFADKLERAAKLNFGKEEKLDSDVVYDPDLNDGVVLNIAPLWELVPWKLAKDYWEELLEGKYEWSSMGKLLRAKGLVK